MLLNPIVFSNIEQNKIKFKILDKSFTYKNWSDDDLLEIRSAIRNHYRTQQKGTCAYCKKDVSLHSAANCHVEHIVPKSIHFNFIFEPKNLCVICADCNEIKRNQETLCVTPDTITNKNPKIYPRSSNAFKIIHPFFDEYSEHIVILDGLYADKSEKGSFTIWACKLNRKLHQFGYSPEYIDDVTMIDMMQRFIASNSSSERDSLLNRIKSSTPARSQ